MLRRTVLMGGAPAMALTAQREPIGIGFLDIGHPHGEAKLQTARAAQDYRVIGVAERDPRLADKLRGQGLAVVSREELLADPKVRVVAVESAVKHHAEDALAALRAGKHLHLEKAPSDKLADFREIVDLARGKGLLVQVGYMWRYHPGFVKALEIARQGWLGQVYLLKASVGILQAAERRSDLAGFPGGVMFEMAGHLIDPMVRLLGRPQVTPFLRTDGARDSLRDNNAAIFQWDKAMGIVQCSALQPNSFRYRALEIHGSGGCAILNPIEPPVLTLDLARPAGPYSPGVQKVEVGSYRRYVDDFVELAAAVRGETRLRVTPEEDLMVHEALLRASGMA